MVKFLDGADFQTALIIGILIFGVFVSGCSDQSNTTTTTSMPTTTPFQPKFVAGDIIAKTTTSPDTFWLIVKYDAKIDKYERALSYKKSDGSWYRKDGKTEPFDRAQMEKLYPAKVAHVNSISEVPVATLATTTAPATSPITTTTTVPLPAPTVTGIAPNSEMIGTTVNITGITGTNFRVGATVRLVQGGATITGSNVNTVSASNITCQFVISSSAGSGAWNVTVINPDGQSGTLINSFTVTNTTTTTQPTTTSTPTTTTTTAPPPTVMSIDGSNHTSTTPGWGITINIGGSGFQSGSSVKFRKSGSPDIPMTYIQVISSAQITGGISIPIDATPGQWDIVVTNPDGQSGTLSNGFTVCKAYLNYCLIDLPPTILGSISPSTGMVGQYVQLTISGNNFQIPARVFFNKGRAVIECSNVDVISPTQINCILPIPQGTTTGQWDIIVNNIQNKQGNTLSGGFFITDQIITATPNSTQT